MDHIQDDSTEDIQISNAADWVKFNTPTTQKTNDPFKIEGEDLVKVSGLSPIFITSIRNLSIQLCSN